MNAKAFLGLLALLPILVGCESMQTGSKYGGRPVDVTLSIAAVEGPGTGGAATPAAASSPQQGGEIRGWVLSLAEWFEFQGQERLAQYAGLRSSEDPAAEATLAELVLDLDRIARFSGRPPLTVTIPMELHYFIARWNDELEWVEFNSLSDRSVSLSLGRVEP